MRPSPTGVVVAFALLMFVDVSLADQVLLIDADLRRPTVHKHFDFKRDGGLTNYMLSAEGGDTWRHFVKPWQDSESLGVLTSGPLPPKPVELFGSKRFNDLISQVKRSFDWVVIDSPPVVSLAGHNICDLTPISRNLEILFLLMRRNEAGLLT